VHLGTNTSPTMHGGMGFFSRDEIFSYASKSSSGQGQNAGRPAGLTAGYSALRTVRRLKPMSGCMSLAARRRSSGSL